MKVKSAIHNRCKIIICKVAAINYYYNIYSVICKYTVIPRLHSLIPRFGKQIYVILSVEKCYLDILFQTQFRINECQ